MEKHNGMPKISVDMDTQEKLCLVFCGRAHFFCGRDNKVVMSVR